MASYEYLSLKTITWLLLGQSVIIFLAAVMVGPALFFYATIQGDGLLSWTDLLTITCASAPIIMMMTISRALSLISSILAAYYSLRVRGNLQLSHFLALTPVFACFFYYGYSHFLPRDGFPVGIYSPYPHGFSWKQFSTAWLIELAIACAYWFPLRKLRSVTASANRR